MGEWDTKTQLEIAHQAGEAAKVHRISRTPEHILQKYRKCKNWWAFPKEFMVRSLGDLEGKEILDFGCGTGEMVLST